MAVAQSLVGLRVLVVKDEMLVSLMIEDFLRDQMLVVIGPYSNVGPALAAAQGANIDFALLDVNLNGARVYPVAEALQARGVPFLIISGYDEDVAVPAGRPAWRFCSKPFKFDVLTTMMIEELNRGRPGRHFDLSS